MFFRYSSREIGVASEFCRPVFLCVKYLILLKK